MPLEPSANLESCIRICESALQAAGVPHWLAFGGLWGLVRNEGVVPDHDLDYCTYYGQDWKMIKKFFESSGYSMPKTILSDTDQSKALYCSLSNDRGLPHVCLSFWFPHGDNYYYCHDQKHEVAGVGVPASGYWFRGVPKYLVEKDVLRMVEWPGINQQYKVSVPRFAGGVLDHMYIDWAYQKQRFEIGANRAVLRDRCKSYHKGGATSPFEVHVQSMEQWNDKKYIDAELAKSMFEWKKKLKNAL